PINTYSEVRKFSEPDRSRYGPVQRRPAAPRGRKETMTRPNDPVGTALPPSLAELTARYLQRQTAAREAGITPAESGEVVLFEAAPVPPVDPRTAWDEALDGVRLYSPTKPVPSVQPPPDWSTLVAGQEPAAALAFAAGNFPQLV